MTAAIKLEEDDSMRERRDIVSGEVLPENRLIRFVADPDGNVVPDAAAKLPGRGLWVEASKAAIDKAVEKKLFSRAAKAQAQEQEGKGAGSHETDKRGAAGRIRQGFIALSQAASAGER